MPLKLPHDIIIYVDYDIRKRGADVLCEYIHIPASAIYLMMVYCIVYKYLVRYSWLLMDTVI